MKLLLGDCLDLLPTLADASVDAVISDPPYPCIDRSYGRLTEAEWWALMVDGVIPQVRRVLKPTGSAVFVLQPNSRKVGSMRGWLFEFQAWCCREWNMVQDAWWWNTNAAPMTKNDPDLMRASIKACIWLGPPSCYRNGKTILWAESDSNRIARTTCRVDNSLQKRSNERLTFRETNSRVAAKVNGGVTAFNLLPFSNAGDSGPMGHPAATPLDLCSWWVRYICPPGGIVLDTFSGTATVGVAAVKLGRDYIGIERDAGYHAIAQRRLAAALDDGPLIRAMTGTDPQATLFEEMP